MAAKDQALQLLSQGLTVSQVAGILGVEDSYISQLMQNEDFSTAVVAARQQASAEDLAYDEKLDKAEEVFLERIEEKSRLANLQQSMQAFKILNSAKRRKDRGVAPAAGVHATIVNITVPAAIAPRFIMNQQSEIVEVEGQTMISATPKGLDTLVSARKLAQVEQLAEQRKQEQNARALQHLEAPARRNRKQPPSDLFDVSML